ncbi:S-adenosyl-L-methionine-dependent methyltransferases superfamily protein [Actinidia rufa]|uniref:S-adenosyl-L-methionine-dependent methyltransferases superfamily protein n=1 Tax=Actinidia rufa TaxID=165716 RepID=A0A7J0DZ39_9ERIC|nr:S-adenosyl-L-methionine-dependent methyltransferases superfamily protein [Actinidia rufa]
MPSKIAQIRLVGSHFEVYEPCDDSFALVDALLADLTNLLEHKPKLCMEVGCGSGTGEKRLAGLVDVMVVNPPYVPTPEEEVGCDGIASAWAGGENGRSVIDKILPMADKLLSDRGWLYMRSTEEESLHVIKFWRDSDRLLEASETGTVNKIVPTRVIESLLSHFPGISLRRSGNSKSS